MFLEHRINKQDRQNYHNRNCHTNGSRGLLCCQGRHVHGTAATVLYCHRQRTGLVDILVKKVLKGI